MEGAPILFVVTWCFHAFSLCQLSLFYYSLDMETGVEVLSRKLGQMASFWDPFLYIQHKDTGARLTATGSSVSWWTASVFLSQSRRSKKQGHDGYQEIENNFRAHITGGDPRLELAWFMLKTWSYCSFLFRDDTLVCFIPFITGHILEFINLEKYLTFCESYLYLKIYLLSFYHYSPWSFIYIPYIFSSAEELNILE